MTVELPEELAEQGPQRPLWNQKVSSCTMYTYPCDICSDLVEYKINLSAVVLLHLYLRGVRGESGTLRNAKLSCWSLLHLNGSSLRGKTIKSGKFTCLERVVLVWKSLLSRPRSFCSRCCWRPRGCQSSAGRAAWRRGQGRWWRWCRRRRRWSPREAPSRRFPW